MKKKPIAFNLIALFFVGVTLSIPLQIAYLYEHDLSSLPHWRSIFIKITPLNFAVMSISIINAYLAFKASPKLKYFLPIGVAITAVNNFFVSIWGTDYNHVQASAATLGYILLSYSYILTDAYEVLKNPKLQWWKIPIRYKQNVPVWIESKGQKKVLTSTFDISESGTFLSTLNKGTTNLMNELHIGEHINLYISTQKGDLKIQGTIVRKEFQARGNYPEGMGIQFSNLGLINSFQLKGLLSNYGLA